MSESAGTAAVSKRKSRGAAGSVEDLDPADVAAAAPAVEAMLISTDRPLSAARLAEGLLAAGAVTAAHADRADGIAKAAVDRLNHDYAQAERAFRIDAVAGGYRVMTTPEHASAVAAIRGAQAKTSLSRAAVETLAIVAYKQPLTRASLEAIRGVACGEILRSLIERRLVTIAGRAEEPGRPMLYGTTKRFLEVFGLASLKDLPSVEEFRSRAGDQEQGAAAEGRDDGGGVEEHAA